MANIIRPLRADEIEVRVGSVNEKGITLLLYKDARVDQQLLDETFGAFNWRRHHECINGSIYCTVEIYDPEKGEWIGKQDVGSAGQMEAEKSAASDSFKRACFLWGCGRELYDSPFIWVSASKVEISKRGDRFACYERFSVHSIVYNENREIVSLIIVNGKGECVYHMQKNQGPSEVGSCISEDQKRALDSELRRTGVPKETVYGRFHIESDKELTVQLYDRMMAALSKTKSVEFAA